MTSKIMLSTTAIATRYSTWYSDFLLQFDSNSTRSKNHYSLRPGEHTFSGTCQDHYIFPNYHYGSPAGRATEDCEPILIHRASNTDSCQGKHKHGSSGDARYVDCFTDIYLCAFHLYLFEILISRRNLHQELTSQRLSTNG